MDHPGGDDQKRNKTRGKRRKGGEAPEELDDVVKFAKGGREVIAKASRERQRAVAEVRDTTRAATRSLGRKVVQARMRVTGTAATAGASLADTLDGLGALEEATERASSAEAARAAASPGSSQPRPGAAPAPVAPRGAALAAAAAVAGLSTTPEEDAEFECAAAFCGGSGPGPRLGVLLSSVAAASERLQPTEGEVPPAAVVSAVAHRWALTRSAAARLGQPRGEMLACVGATRWLRSTGQLRRAIGAGQEAATLAQALAVRAGASGGKGGATLEAQARALGGQALEEVALAHDALVEPGLARAVREAAVAMRSGAMDRTADEAGKAAPSGAKAAARASAKAAPAATASAKAPVNAAPTAKAAKAAVPAKTAKAAPAVTGGLSSAADAALRGGWDEVRAIAGAAAAGDDGARAWLCATEHRTGATALMLAAGRGDAVMVRLLVAAGAGVSARDKRGATAVWWALCLKGGKDGWEAAVAMAEAVGGEAATWAPAPMPAQSGAVPAMSGEAARFLLPAGLPRPPTEEAARALRSFAAWLSHPRIPPSQAPAEVARRQRSAAAVLRAAAGGGRAAGASTAASGAGAVRAAQPVPGGSAAGLSPLPSPTGDAADTA